MQSDYYIITTHPTRMSRYVYRVSWHLSTQTFTYEQDKIGY